MRKVTLGTTIAYGMPGLGAGYMYLLMSLYVMKFSTDVLLIAPAVMGVIFSISRIWDAVSDPIAGYLSDRTTFKFGRRRTWMLISFIPISFGFLAVFSPPESMQGQSLDLWMMIAILSFYSAITLLNVPHMALGAELSEDYHERTRLFGVRHIGFTLGSILALVSMSLLISEENNPDGDVRQLAGSLAFYAIGAMSLMIFFAVSKLKENPEFQNRVNKNPFKAFRDVWINPHAKILIIVLFIENLGGAVIGVLTLYVTQYIVEAPAWAPLIIFAYMLPSALSVPLWIPLSRRFGKIRLWVFSLAFTGISFGGIFIIPFLDSITDRLIVMFIGAALGGMAAGCGGAIGPSVKGDVIDYDEYLTGERKEGSYFAALNFVFKSATGIMLLVTGFVLQFSGFIPNQPQTMEVKIALISLYGLVPLVFYSLGAFLLYKKFKFGEKEHAAIKQQIQERA
ncbi:MFS transporter [SAR86 cluster bacterium]|nr:MFS transporter [SAR86 cluster bacterium]